MRWQIKNLVDHFEHFHHWCIFWSLKCSLGAFWLGCICHFKSCQFTCATKCKRYQWNGTQVYSFYLRHKYVATHDTKINICVNYSHEKCILMLVFSYRGVIKHQQYNYHICVKAHSKRMFMLNVFIKRQRKKIEKIHRMFPGVKYDKYMS